ncbi:MAG: UDP-glucose/GDP-mannose dehydrogenase family protein [Herminiimonas sp.]|uniref:UDP-glucose dehydrogenase family protein n=1 Tax=Herminiimonas sp. TaxID=1926289 RepID=UPI002717E8CE|nr:UDP-glucose/GDP-mannose dehydrogenase family protein [Herminiimonas sp.]MDO9419795.1 UDP-glucose/GDP-mannose dehydrogenase family protein [Herminiimonas sp.]
MKITVIGTGYVGLVTGACLAELGNNVLCVDVDTHKIAVLNNGGVPIHELGLKELIVRNVNAGRLRFSDDIVAGANFGDIQFIAVGTPPDEDGSADLQYVLSAARNIGAHLSEFKVVVNKSTVPVGTADKVGAVIQEELDKRGETDIRFSVVSNPEFLKEGVAIEDFMRPDRIVIGTNMDEAGQKAQEIMNALYAPFVRNHNRILFMDLRSAEFTKYAANAMLATRISFMNELANLADDVGADIELVRQGIGSDPRIGYSFLYAGTGYGGSCFPKDVQALIHIAQENGSRLHVLEAVEKANEYQKNILTKKIEARLGHDLTGMTFAVWGLAFKPDTDDMRAAPSRVVVRELLARGAAVRAYDPVAIDEAKRVFAMDLEDEPALLARLEYSTDALDAVAGADGLVIMTEWKAFRSPDLKQLKTLLKTPYIFDGRNLYDPALCKSVGIEYFGVGRGHIKS